MQNMRVAMGVEAPGVQNASNAALGACIGARQGGGGGPITLPRGAIASRRAMCA